MNRFPIPSGSSAAAATLLWLLALPCLAAAQSNPDFLFRDPKVSLSFRLGYALPTVSSDVFDDARTNLTLESSDFGSFNWAGQLAIRATSRVDIAVDMGYSSSSSRSEMRDWVGVDDLPIEQVTEFKRLPLTIGVKAYLAERGQRIGRFAWIPEKWAPFLGAGFGVVWFDYDQTGEFVDYVTLDIFRDHFTSEGSAPTIHVFGGADWSLGPTLFLTAEGRYGWAKADMGSDFVDFDQIDLSGFQATAGISLRF